MVVVGGCGRVGRLVVERLLLDDDASYVDLVNSYYNLATDFYEWGWGQSFHFAERLPAETFGASIARHEYYLAARMGVQPSDHFPGSVTTRSLLPGQCAR